MPTEQEINQHYGATVSIGYEESVDEDFRPEEYNKFAFLMLTSASAFGGALMNHENNTALYSLLAGLGVTLVGAMIPANSTCSERLNRAFLTIGFGWSTGVLTQFIVSRIFPSTDTVQYVFLSIAILAGLACCAKQGLQHLPSNFFPAGEGQVVRDQAIVPEQPPVYVRLES